MSKGAFPLAMLCVASVLMGGAVVLHAWWFWLLTVVWFYSIDRVLRVLERAERDLERERDRHEACHAAMMEVLYAPSTD